MNCWKDHCQTPAKRLLLATSEPLVPHRTGVKQHLVRVAETTFAGFVRLKPFFSLKGAQFALSKRASVSGMAMQCRKLTDDELWRAIAENTNAMSRLVRQQLELDAYMGLGDPYRAYLMRFHLARASKFQREYQDCTAELRRRYL